MSALVTPSFGRGGASASVLVADSDPQVARVLIEVLAGRGIRAHVVSDRKAGLDFLERNQCDAAFVGGSVLCPHRGSDTSLHAQLLEPWTAHQPELPVVLILSPETMLSGLSGCGPDACLRGAAAVVRQALAAGCHDVLIRPAARAEAERILAELLPNRPVAQVAAAQDGGAYLYRIVGQGPRMRHLVELAGRIAPTSAPVLISGENGTGKELIAYLIHHRSRRSLGPYVRVNCAALSDSLLESELFGHEKGAFTGAVGRHKGRFERAHGGTLLLDEISETPLRFQAKLLRILEQQEFERVGGCESVQVNVRVISTTNRNLLDEVRQGRFRQDLYYRLSATRLVVPALREQRRC